MKDLRSKVHVQMMTGNLLRKDYTLKLKEIKELEANSDIAWGDYAPKELIINSLQTNSKELDLKLNQAQAS